MRPRHQLARDWAPLVLLACACSTDPCLDDGFRQDPPSKCPTAAGTEGDTDGDPEDPQTTSAETTGAETTEAEVPTCENGVRDPGEAGVDCGAQACPNLCALGYTCDADEDCASTLCSPQGRCIAPPTCDDEAQNADETDVDCGGPDCDPCEDGLMCALDTDCASAVCDEAVSTCSAPACDDGAQNGDETDVDCGGPDCDPC